MLIVFHQLIERILFEFISRQLTAEKVLCLPCQFHPDAELLWPDTLSDTGFEIDTVPCKFGAGAVGMCFCHNQAMAARPEVSRMQNVAVFNGT